MSEAVVVLSDLHANARALREAIKVAKAGPVDRIVILGDLLTYGIDVEETLEIVDELERGGAAVIAGNHDQLYFDAQSAPIERTGKLPEWLQESLDYTLARLTSGFALRYRWQKSTRIDSATFFHANPYEYGDWTYLSSDGELLRAAAAVDPGEVIVCGHTHRAEIALVDAGRVERLGRTVDIALAPSRLLLNVGSIGQPRHKNAESTLLRIQTAKDRVRASIETVPYDVSAHLEGIARAELSEPTRQKLASFFVGDAASLVTTHRPVRPGRG